MDSALHDPDINNSNYLLGRSALNKSMKHYSSFHQILLVGEGDFSFSSALANAFGSAENMVPTSLDSREEVLQLYKSAQKTLSNLEKLGATILHGVDATTMEKHHILRKMRFHRIVYNFPHAGFYGKEEDQQIIEKHRDLLNMFFKNARSMLSEIGEIHVTHKAYGPYKRWELVKQAQECGLLLKESVQFAIEDYPGYTNRRGAGSNAGHPFSLGECQTYKFVLGPNLLHQRKLLAIQVVLSNVPSEASAENFRMAVLEPESEMQARISASEDRLRAALLELESEKKSRKAAEISKAALESAFNRLREFAHEALKKNDEFAKQRDDALRQKDEACRENEAIAQQLYGALRLKENAFKQRDEIISRQRNDLARQKDEILRLKEEATKGNQTLMRIANGTEERLKNLKPMIEKQKPVVYDQLNHIFKAQECLLNIIKKIDGSAYDQSMFSEPLFASQVLDIDKDLLVSLAGSMFVSKLAIVASQKINIDQEKRNKEKKELEDNIVSLVAEKRDTSALLKSALREAVGDGKDFKELTEDNGDSQTDLPRRNGAISDLAEMGFQNAGLDFKDGALVGDPDIVVMAFALENIIKTSQLEIAELRRRLKTLRAEHNEVRRLSEIPTKDLAEKTLHIQEPEEKARVATENVEGLVMDIAATEIGRWREAAEQEAEPRKLVTEEFQEKTVDSSFENHERIRYTREQLLQLQEASVDISDDIHKAEQEIELGIVIDESIWGRGDINAQPHIRYANPDTRDWQGRSPLHALASEERSWETLRDSREYGIPMSKQQVYDYKFSQQEQANLQFSKLHVSSASVIATLGRELEEKKQSVNEANNKLLNYKEEIASAAATARDMAEITLRLAGRTIDQTVRRAKWWG